MDGVGHGTRHRLCMERSEPGLPLNRHADGLGEAIRSITRWLEIIAEDCDFEVDNMALPRTEGNDKTST